MEGEGRKAALLREHSDEARTKTLLRAHGFPLGCYFKAEQLLRQREALKLHIIFPGIIPLFQN